MPPPAAKPAPAPPAYELTRQGREARIDELLREIDQLKFKISKLTKQRDNLAAKRLATVGGGSHE